jgi:hypothetical protein
MCFHGDTFNVVQHHGEESVVGQFEIRRVERAAPPGAMILA